MYFVLIPCVLIFLWLLSFIKVYYCTYFTTVELAFSLAFSFLSYSIRIVTYLFKLFFLGLWNVLFNYLVIQALFLEIILISCLLYCLVIQAVCLAIQLISCTYSTMYILTCLLNTYSSCFCDVSCILTQLLIIKKLIFYI